MDLLDRYKAEVAAKQMKEMSGEFKLVCQAVSEQLYIYMSELIKAGFTHDQALAVILHHGVDVGKILLRGNDQ